MNEINIRKIFGENVKKYRKLKGLSQEQMAEKLEISPNHLSVIETGSKFVSYRLLERIVHELDVLPATLFFTTGTAQFDQSLLNRINAIVSTELKKTAETVQQRIAEELFQISTKQSF